MQAILIFSFSSLALRGVFYGIFLQHSIEGYGEAVCLLHQKLRILTLLSFFW